VWLASVAAGVGVGAFSLLADGIVGGRLVGILGNIASPWGLVAFFVGRLATEPKQGAVAGALTLVVGVAVYFLGGALRGYAVGEVDLVWTAIALAAGPAMGWSGAAIASEPDRPPILAVAAPSAMLVAEAIFLAIDRKVWHYDLQAETYRLVDLGVMVALLVGGVVLPVLFEKDRRRRRLVYLVVALAGVGGAVGFVLLREFIVGLV
jgi:predicted permease